VGFRTRLALPSFSGLPVEATPMTDDLRYSKNLSRTNYWNFPAINPVALFEGMGLDTIDSFAHEKLSADCQQLHEAGNTEVIFEYVKKDVWAFRSP
jgi:hypothetical protein